MKKLIGYARLGLLACAPTVAPPPAFAQPKPSAPPATQERDGSRDFDFEFGTWKLHLSRRTNPLSGTAATWVDYDGTSVLRKVWGGAANAGEIDVTGPAGRIEGMTVRLYDPQSHQWNVYFASRKSGELGRAMVGGFSNGRGEFYNQETINGRAVFVRFVFSDITPTSFRLEQAFSADGGKTWEANWLARFTR